MAYIKQWQAVTVYEVDEVDKRMAEFNGCDFSKVAWYNMTDSELDSAIRECFEKAVSHGNTEAEDHYMQYKKEMDDYKKRGPCPDIFRVGIDVKADDEKNLSKEGESK